MGVVFILDAKVELGWILRFHCSKIKCSSCLWDQVSLKEPKIRDRSLNASSLLCGTEHVNSLNL